MEANKRQSTRTQVEVEVQTVSDDKFTIAGRTLDISAKGLFVMCDRRFPVGTSCRVQIFPGDNKTQAPVRAEGKVVRTAKSGMGIEITQLDPQNAEALKKLVASRSENLASDKTNPAA